MRIFIVPIAMLALTACQPKEKSQTNTTIDPTFECGTQPNDVQITACLERQVQASSARVKKAFERNLKEAATADKEMAAFEEPLSTFDLNTHVKALNASQAAWQKYVEAHCELEGYTALGGTAQLHYTLLCWDRLNLQRLKDLRSPFMLESQRLQPVPEE